MVTSKFCPKCGKKTNKLYEGICDDCTVKAITPVQITRKNISMCATCSTIFDGIKPYNNMSVDEIFYTIISRRIMLDKNLRDPEAQIYFNIPKEDMKGAGKAPFPCKIEIKAKTEAGFKIEQKKEFDMIVKFIQCEKCSKKATNYFEGILQIRNASTIEKKILVRDRLSEIMKEQEKRSVFITSVVDQKNGYDCYVTSQRHIKEIGRRLHDSFGGELKINEQLFSHDAHKGKDLFRVNVLIRLPDYIKGNIIKEARRTIQIKSIKGNIINGIDLQTGKDIHINTKDKDVKLVAKESDIYLTTIALVKPNLEILNPITYQSESVANPEILGDIKSRSIGDEVHIFLYNDVIWIVKD